MRHLALLLLALSLLAAKPALTSDGAKYLAEAKKRITRIESEIASAKADAEKAARAKKDLLASKRFLDNVQLEQPAHPEAGALQKKADALLAELRPAIVKSAVERRTADIEDAIGVIEKELAATPRDAVADERLRDHFEMLRAMVREVLEAEPANAKALAARERENSLWERYRAQREAKSPPAP